MTVCECECREISTCQMTHTLCCTHENCVAIVARQQRRSQGEGKANGNQQLSAPRGVCGSVTRLKEEAEANEMQQRLRQCRDSSLSSIDSFMCYTQLPRIAASCCPCPRSRVDELTRDTIFTLCQIQTARRKNLAKLKHT